MEARLSEQYFDTGSTIEAQESCRWFDVNVDVPTVELAPNLTSNPVIAGGMALSYITFAPHAVAPVHRHDEEQIVFVLEGELEFEVGGETRLLRPGMGIVIPPNVPHGARTYDSACKEVDIFHPPRRMLIEKLAELERIGGAD